jgi:hypothetical protein
MADDRKSAAILVTPAEALAALCVRADEIEKQASTELAEVACIALGSITVERLEGLERERRVISAAAELKRRFEESSANPIADA